MRVIPETSEQLSYLIRLDFDENDERIKIGGSGRTILVDYWRAPSILHVPVDVMTNERELLQGQFAARGMASTLLIENVQRSYTSLFFLFIIHRDLFLSILIIFFLWLRLVDYLECFLLGYFLRFLCISWRYLINYYRFMDEKKEETRKDRSLWNNKAGNEFTTNYHTNAEVINPFNR